MKSRRRIRQQKAGLFHPDQLADHPPQRRTRAELNRVERILDSLPTKQDMAERSVSR